MLGAFTGFFSSCRYGSSSVPTIARRARTSAAVPVSNSTNNVKKYIKIGASLPNADPLNDSQTSRLSQQQAPYLLKTYIKPPPIFHKGEGCFIWDIENRRYLDFSAGIAVNALGHSDSQVARVIEQQARTLVHCSNLYHNPWTGELSKLLIETTLYAGGMADVSRVFVCNSGSEANEAALKFCRKHGRIVDPSGSKFEFLSFRNSFHGRTFGSLSATSNDKYQAPFSPMIPGFRYGELNDLDALNLITQNTCGVIVEPIQGEGGVHEASPTFLSALRKRCNETGALLVYDEIQCGLSRTGKFWAHCALPPSAHPDILTTAKALGNGFPVGATLVTEAVANAIVPGDHGTTFGGNPLAARVAHHVVERLADPNLQADVRRSEHYFRLRLKLLQEKFPLLITEIRGRGLILGVQMSHSAAKVVTAARERGLLIITAGKETLRLVPPLIVKKHEIEEGLDILEESISIVIDKDKISKTEGQQEMG